MSLPDEDDPQSEQESPLPMLSNDRSPLNFDDSPIKLTKSLKIKDSDGSAQAKKFKDF